MKRLNNLLLLTLFAAVTLALGSCKKDDDIAAKDDKIIRDYIAANNLDAEKTASGLYYVIDEPGNSQHPTLANEVRVKYSGYFTDGKVFDEATLTLPLYGVIKGWQEGIPLFGKGGKGMLLIPSKLGYGSDPRPGIPANAVLIFNIHLIDIK